MPSASIVKHGKKYRVIWREGGRGSQRHVSEGFKQKSGAEAERERIIERLRAAEPLGNRTLVPIGEVLNRWLLSRKAERNSTDLYLAKSRKCLESLIKAKGWSTTKDVTRESVAGTKRGALRFVFLLLIGLAVWAEMTPEQLAAWDAAVKQSEAIKAKRDAEKLMPTAADSNGTALQQAQWADEDRKDAERRKREDESRDRAAAEDQRRIDANKIRIVEMQKISTEQHGDELGRQDSSGGGNEKFTWPVILICTPLIILCVVAAAYLILCPIHIGIYRKANQILIIKIICGIVLLGFIGFMLDLYSGYIHKDRGGVLSVLWIIALGLSLWESDEHKQERLKFQKSSKDENATVD